MTVSLSIEDPTHETTVKVVEEELASEESESQIGEKEIEKEQEIPVQRKKRKKTIVSSSDLVEDPIHEATAKAVEQEHSKAIIVFERAEKRRQQQFLRDEPAAAAILQRATVRGQQTARDYILRSSPIIAGTSGASNFILL